MQIEIVGQDAVQVTEELLAIDGIKGSYEVLNAVQREITLATIATIVGIVGGSLTIAEKLYELNKKYQNSLNPTEARVEKVMIINGDNRLLLKDATIEQIKDILEG
jgi:hypothetical protein